jgi:hypothetical protein
MKSVRGVRGVEDGKVFNGRKGKRRLEENIND